jgi:hypothetical protein
MGGSRVLLVFRLARATVTTPPNVYVHHSHKRVAPLSQKGRKRRQKMYYLGVAVEATSSERGKIP